MLLARPLVLVGRGKAASLRGENNRRGITVQLHRPTGQFMVQLCREKDPQGRRPLGQADREAAQHEEKRHNKRAKNFFHTGNIHNVTAITLAPGSRKSM